MTTREHIPAIPTPAAPRPRRLRAPTRSEVAAALSGLLVVAALVAPREIGQLTPAAFVRIPVEALAGVALLLVVAPRARRLVAVTGGAFLGLLTILKVVDMGFLAVLARPFDPVLDWVLFGNALSFLTDSIGPAGAVASAVAAAVVAIVLVVVMAAAVGRLSRVVATRRTVAVRCVAVGSVVWIACAATGAQLVAPVPVAARSTASLAWQKARQIPVSLADQEEFVAASAVDAFRDTPDSELLTALRGKDVVLSYVESYGRSALEDPELAPQVDAVLDAGTRRLDAAGFASRSAFLTSSTAGGGSWLAHATLGSGLWITNQQRHDGLVEGNRLTLTSAFQRAGWDTVAVMPGTSADWKDSRFYGFNRVRDSRTMGNRATTFTGFFTPDQYTLAEFQHDERARPGRGPLMAEIPLVTSHWPWTHIPRLVDWTAVGDGSVFDTMDADIEPADAVLNDPHRARANYSRSIGYSLESLISYVETYGDDNLVLVFLGDHQPSPQITGDAAGRDVPITIVARDPAVLDRVAGWGWDNGLNPGPGAPVWRMDAFRDRFLTAFGP